MTAAQRDTYRRVLAEERERNRIELAGAIGNQIGITPAQAERVDLEISIRQTFAQFAWRANTLIDLYESELERLSMTVVRDTDTIYRLQDRIASLEAER